MRKNAPRKWLHAVLDLLPVIMIPVFMIYSHRHDIDTYTLNVAESKVVDFNQLAYPINDTNYRIGSGDVTITNNLITFNGNGLVDEYVDTRFNFVKSHYYYFRFDSNNSITGNATVIAYIGDYYTYNVPIGTSNGYIRQAVSDNSDTINFRVQNYSSGTWTIANLNVFDLTQMFGSGNEPTIEQFNQWYTDSNYARVLSHKELLKNYSTITYNDSDIMSQLTYNMYNSVDKYFNMNNVFGMTRLYDWFNLNIFNGNAPLYVYIVWNVILYEFIMDLLFLLYALFMFFVDICQDLIERCFKSGKGD